MAYSVTPIKLTGNTVSPVAYCSPLELAGRQARALMATE